MGFNRAIGFQSTKASPPPPPAPIPAPAPTGNFLTGEGGGFFLNEDGLGSALIIE